MKSYREELAELTREADLWEPLEGRRVRCLACGHRCPVLEGFPGVCKVRENRGGKLYAPYGYVHALACDPIEKKPFFHVCPGGAALSFGMVGCDLHCAYCQNWLSSQALRDPQAAAGLQPYTAGEIVDAALRRRAACVVSTYNEPLITAEWAVEIFRLAKPHGLLTGFVSNGNATPEVLAYLRPHLDLFKVDLKSFDDHRYRELGGRLAPILDSIGRIHALGFWLEVVTLVVPGFNDTLDELRSIAGFLAGISRDIPWHVTAFHPDYRMTEQERTPADTLRRTAEVGVEAGLRYVYAGNLAGQLDGWENTYCPSCRALLIERRGFRVLRNLLAAGGRCPACASAIPGVWQAPVRL